MSKTKILRHILIILITILAIGFIFTISPNQQAQARINLISSYEVKTDGKNEYVQGLLEDSDIKTYLLTYDTLEDFRSSYNYCLNREYVFAAKTEQVSELSANYKYIPYYASEGLSFPIMFSMFSTKADSYRGYSSQRPANSLLQNYIWYKAANGDINDETYDQGSTTYCSFTSEQMAYFGLGNVSNSTLIGTIDEWQKAALKAYVNEYGNNRNNVEEYVQILKPTNTAKVSTDGEYVGPFKVQYPNFKFNGSEYPLGNFAIEITDTAGNKVKVFSDLTTNPESKGKLYTRNSDGTYTQIQTVTGLPESGTEFYVKGNFTGTTTLKISYYLAIDGIEVLRAPQNIIKVTFKCKDKNDGSQYYGCGATKDYYCIGIVIPNDNNMSENKLRVNIDTEWFWYDDVSGEYFPFTKTDDGYKMDFQHEQGCKQCSNSNATEYIEIKNVLSNGIRNWYITSESSHFKIDTQALERQFQDAIEIIPEREIYVEKEVKFTVEEVNANLAIDLSKIDTVTNKKLSGAKFKVEVYGGSGTGYYTTSSTETSFIKIIPEGNTNEIRVTLKEVTAPSGYRLIEDELEFVYKYNINTKTWELKSKNPTELNGYIVGNNLTRTEKNGEIYDILYITCYNQQAKNKLKIVKINSRNENPIAGITFQITLDNARTTNGYSVFSRTTNSEGEIETSFFEMIDESKPCYITVKEIDCPDDGNTYTGFEEAKFKLVYENGRYNVSTFSGDTNAVEIDYIVTESTIELTIENTVQKITQKTETSGIVWLDGQTGIKPVTSPDGIMQESEKTVKGVKVELCYRYLPLAEAKDVEEEEKEANAERTEETYTEAIRKQLYKINVLETVITDEDGTFTFDNIEFKNREELWNDHKYQAPEDTYDEEDEPENCYNTKIDCVHDEHDEDCFDHNDEICEGEEEYCDHECTVDSGCYTLICEKEAHTHTYWNGCYTYNSETGKNELTCEKESHTHNLDECYDKDCLHSHEDGCDDNHHDWEYSDYYYDGDVDCYYLNHDEHYCDDPDSYFPDDNGDDYPCYYCPETCTDTVAVEWCIRFTYDGINYTTVSAFGYDNPWESDVDSDAEENNRTYFNQIFSTITGDSELEYTYEGNKAILQTGYTKEETDYYISAGEAYSKFEIEAQTRWLTAEEMKNSKNKFGLGLVKKGVDLAAATTIKSAEVDINGEKINYSYNDIRNLVDGTLLMPTEGEQDKCYNLYLYSSDYNYRIGDYSDLANRLSPTKEDLLNKDYSIYTTKKHEDKELEVYVTYQVAINNQSSTSATVNKIAYYYDTKYELVKLGNSYQTATPELETIDGKTYNKIIIDAYFDFNSTVNHRTETLTFRVKKDSNGNVYTGQMKNWVEIISYSTDSGCIDIDSAPDNITKHSHEDDSDYQDGIQISLRNELERKISGYVFEDKDTGDVNYLIGDGYYEAGNKDKVNGVIAQLIEIKEVNGQRLEYIWQETVTGSGVVKFITNDGKEISSYTNNATAKGQFEFKNFTAGNYIVRFIYGDKTYYETKIDGTANNAEGKAEILKYNGKDYKSTKDIFYNNVYFNNEYAANQSMARDNEARRLEVMQNMVDIDLDSENPIYPVTGVEGLEALWMCAETSIIKMPVAKPTDNTNSEAVVINGSASTESATKTINFGLTKAPQADLRLEKHLTEIKIDGVLQAITDFANCLSEEVNFTYEQGENVFATSTNKNNNQRGEWLIQTQIDNILGKRMDVVYTYLVKNIGDKCYIGAALSEILDNTTAPISGLYSNIAELIKIKMKNVDNDYEIGTYLGTAYYNGDTSHDKEVAAVVKIEDYLNTANKLEMIEDEDFAKVINPNGNKETWQKTVLALSKNAAGTLGTISDKTEELYTIQSREEIKLYAGQQKELKLHLYRESLDKNTEGNIQFLSYAAQLVQPDSMVGKASKLVKYAVLGNLKYAQSYVHVRNYSLGTLLPESDETIAETITITQNTGEDKETPIVMILSITCGIVIIAIGIVLIKKFSIKK